jgi:hypothetical protein
MEHSSSTRHATQQAATQQGQGHNGQDDMQRSHPICILIAKSNRACSHGYTKSECKMDQWIRTVQTYHRPQQFRDCILCFQITLSEYISDETMLHNTIPRQDKRKQANLKTSQENNNKTRNKKDNTEKDMTRQDTTRHDKDTTRNNTAREEKTRQDKTNTR